MCSGRCRREPDGRIHRRPAGGRPPSPRSAGSSRRRSLARRPLAASRGTHQPAQGPGRASAGRRASAAGARRELVGHDDPADALGPALICAGLVTAGRWFRRRTTAAADARPRRCSSSVPLSRTAPPGSTCSLSRERRRARSAPDRTVVEASAWAAKTSAWGAGCLVAVHPTRRFSFVSSRPAVVNVRGRTFRSAPAAAVRTCGGLRPPAGV